MSDIPALRLRHEHVIPLEGISLSGGYTLEAWVCPAPMDRAARLYPETGYEGNVVRLKPGLYRNMAENHLSQLSSVCLPEDIEAVFFTEPDFRGEALAQRDDLHEVPESHRKVGSVVVLDRSHRRQNQVVLFEKAGYQGKAEVLILPDSWQPDAASTGTISGSAQKGKTSGFQAFMAKSDGASTATVPGLTQVGSAWVPPGVALEVKHTAGKSTVRGDLSGIPEGVTRIEPRRDAPLDGNEMIYTTADDTAKEIKSLPKVWLDNVPEFKTVRIPAGRALFLFEEANFGGRHEIVVDSRDDLSDLPWTPKSAAYAETPDDVDGVLSLKPDVKVFAPGKPLPAETDAWFPPGYCLVHSSGERMGASGLLTGKNMAGYTVERYLGIIANDAGYGLTIERKVGELRGAPDELRFGGVLLRPDRWYHLAQTWDGQTMQWILDGRPVKQLVVSDLQLENTTWVLGQGFRGAVAQLRAWNWLFSVEENRTMRYPGVSVLSVFPYDQGLPKNLLEGRADPGSLAQPPDAAVITADLPQAPADTVLVQGMKRQVDAEHQQNMQAARQDAAAQTAQGRKQAQRKLALAREQARRDVHFKGIEMMGFVRGDSIWKGKPGSGALDRAQPVPDDHGTRILDLAISAAANSLFVIHDGGAWRVFRSGGERINPHDPFPPRAMALDDSGNNAISKIGSDVYTGVYWVLSDGKFHRTWYLPNGEKTDKHKELFEAPLGNPNAWDMALDTERQVLYWTNGRELYWSKVDGESPTYDILLPHVVSPFPVAVSVAPDGSVVWLDAEDEVLRMLPFDKQTSKFGKPKDLYPAPKPTRGLAVCSLADDQKSGNEAAFVYWVAKERRTLEAPVLDTPGRYIDLRQGPKHPRAYGQHGDVVAVEEIIGAKWEKATLVIPLEGLSNPPGRYDNPLHDIVFGPFSSDIGEGFILTMRVRLDGKRIKDTYSGKYAPALMTIVGFPGDSYTRGEPVHVCVEEMRNRGLQQPFSTGMPMDEWFELKVECRYQRSEPFQVFLNGNLITSPTSSFRVGPVSESNEIFVFLPANKFIQSSSIGKAYGEIAEVNITGLDDSGNILAKQTPFALEGQVKIGSSQVPNKILLEPSDYGTPTKLLVFSTLEDVVVFDPIHLNLRQGWTASAEILWDGSPSGSTHTVCFYELATFEDEDRLVCGIEPDGLPKIYLRWAGHLLTKEGGETKSGTRIIAGNQHRLTWTLSANGRATTYIDGEAVWEMQINWPGGVKVFESHRLGAPNTAQTHAEVKGAIFDDTDDTKITFDGFLGRILRFGAWNTCVPKAAEGWDHTPGPDRTWARSLVTVESKHRYLHAGRLDGLEPSVTLFPLDMDGGLSIETSLDQAHAELTHAHNQQAAAEAHAAQLKEAALQDAHAKADAATKNLASAQAKAAADTARAQEKANSDKAAERQRKADADARAERDRVTGADQAAAAREKGKQQAESQESRAADDKKNKIGGANSRLSEKRSDRDAKQQEYDKKR